MKLHTPVPCSLSVAPTAYIAPSAAVLMVQKMGMTRSRRASGRVSRRFCATSCAATPSPSPSPRRREDEDEDDDEDDDEDETKRNETKRNETDEQKYSKR